MLFGSFGGQSGVSGANREFRAVIELSLDASTAFAPTILMAIYDGGGGTNVNGTTTTVMGGEEDTDNDGGIHLLLEEPGTFGSNGTLPIDLNITNTATSTNVTTTTTTGLGIDASSVGVPYPSTLSPAPSTSSNINSTGARGAMSEFMGDRLLQLVPPPEPQQRQQQ